MRQRFQYLRRVLCFLSTTRFRVRSSDENMSASRRVSVRTFSSLAVDRRRQRTNGHGVINHGVSTDRPRSLPICFVDPRSGCMPINTLAGHPAPPDAGYRQQPTVLHRHHRNIQHLSEISSPISDWWTAAPLLSVLYRLSQPNCCYLNNYAA